VRLCGRGQQLVPALLVHVEHARYDGWHDQLDLLTEVLHAYEGECGEDSHHGGPLQLGTVHDTELPQKACSHYVSTTPYQQYVLNLASAHTPIPAPIIAELT
jgi:tRNA G26 N,N-dimethylase Trm1